MTSHILETPAGTAEFSLDGGVLRTLRVGGVECLRGLSAPVRDADWGVMAETRLISRTDTAPEGVRHLYSAALSRTVRIDMDLALAPSETGLRLTAHFVLSAQDTLQINRAGFCLLHPLGGLRGAALRITHSDGGVTDTVFPDLISPGQPALDIRALSHEVQGLSVSANFEGEIFEMEDQRNWSDASYKTYCRPLSKPRPICLAPGETIEQTVTLEVSGRATGQDRTEDASDETVRIPELWLAAAPGWLMETLPVDCDGIAMRRAPDTFWSDEDIARLAAIRQRHALPLALELVIPEGVEDTAAWMTSEARTLCAAGLSPNYVTVLSAPHLKSHQPGGPWPDAPGPETLARQARDVFSDAAIGRGMLTYFTEFNRCRPEPGAGDFVTYGTSAIVHEAETAPVFQTLEALPDIFRTARMIAGGRPQRLGLVTIGMRSNPYGAALAPPERSFRTMTDRDARHFGPVGAAFGAAAVLVAARAGIVSLCVAAPDGPFGLGTESGAPTPLAEAVAILRRFRGADACLTRLALGHLELTGPAGRLRVMTNPQAPGFSFEESSHGA